MRCRMQDKGKIEVNAFKEMGMIKFWMISTLVYLTFPVSLVVSYVMFGPVLTKQVISALIQDFLQTLLVALVVLMVLMWMIFTYVGPFVIDWFGG
jgi:hypothetical protein